MIYRTLSLPDDYSFFLFGPRGTGKTYLLNEHFKEEPHLYINLLLPSDFGRYSLQPDLLTEELEREQTKWIVIDEVQKLPILLDLVHHHIETSGRLFALCGSSARKLRRGGANLLAGRAFTRFLFPFTHEELGDSFNLEQALAWGTLPKITEFTKNDHKIEFLNAYAQTYLNEEILQEQAVRRLDPFSKFLYVSAKMSGQVLNFSKIAGEIGSTAPTVQNYFQILEDTLVGLILPPWHISVRKRQSGNPKFYYFDTGVLRALSHHLEIPIAQGTYAFGIMFEHLIINEIHRMLSYHFKTFDLSYLRTGSGVEIDLIVERPGAPIALIEIKSTAAVTRNDVRHLQSIAPDVPDHISYCLSLDPKARKIGSVHCLPWQLGLQELMSL